MKIDIFAIFLKNYFASDVKSSKCLHAMQSNALFCTHYVGDVIHRILSHGEISIGKTLTRIVCLSSSIGFNGFCFYTALTAIRTNILFNIL